MIRTFKTRSDMETAALGASLAPALGPGDALLLAGDLGAGKSVLARGVMRALGVEGAIQSPTFTIMQPHSGTRLPVYHFDLYRLSGSDEFYAAGLGEFLDADGVCVIEWPLGEPLPASRISISIERGASDDERLVRMDFSRFARANEAISKLREWEAER